MHLIVNLNVPDECILSLIIYFYLDKIHDVNDMKWDQRITVIARLIF